MFNIVSWLHLVRSISLFALSIGAVCIGGEPPRHTAFPSFVLESRRVQEKGKSGGSHQPANPEPTLERFKVSTDGDFLLLPVELQGKRYWFALDTGSSNAVYDTCFRPILGEPIQTETVWTSGGFIKVPIFRSLKGTVGKLNLPAVSECFCMDLKRFRETSGQEVYGILGLDFLTKHVFRIDFDRGDVTFLTKAGPDAGKRVAIIFHRDAPYVTMEARGLLWQEEFQVDTGNLGNGAIRKENFEKLVKGEFLKLCKSGPHETAAGTRTARFGRVNAINLASFRHENLGFAESDRNRLGLWYWRRFVVTFDFPNGAMYLKKSRQFDTPDLLDRSGLNLLRRKGQILVESVEKGSAAAQAGIKPKDVLQRIDEVKSSDMSLMRIQRLFGEKGKKYRLLILRGERELNLTIHLRE